MIKTSKSIHNLSLSRRQAMNPDFIHSIWRKKRQRTYYVYLFQSIFIGFELTIVQATLLKYLQTTTTSQHQVNLYYDLINAVQYVVPVLFGSPIARWTDTTGDVRLTLILLNVLVLLGTIIYMLPFSPLLLLIGRFLHGFHFVIRSIMYSELTRMFSEQEVTFSYFS